MMNEEMINGLICIAFGTLLLIVTIYSLVEEFKVDRERKKELSKVNEKTEKQPFFKAVLHWTGGAILLVFALIFVSFESYRILLMAISLFLIGIGIWISFGFSVLSI